MRILIIEDEIQAAWNISQSILNVQDDVTILPIVNSIAGLKNWFENNETPDLIFSDIQLGDGIVFDFFKHHELKCPVIFCTAFDEYVLQAFKNNGIDYLLKPIDEKDVKKSLDKLKLLSGAFTRVPYQRLLEKAIAELLNKEQQYKTNFLVPYRDKLIPIPTNQIAFFKITNIISEMVLCDGMIYTHSYSFEYLTSVLDSKMFFRATRQHLISFNCILEIEHYDDRKLLVRLVHPCSENIIVSKAKAASFLNWVKER